MAGSDLEQAIAALRTGDRDGAHSILQQLTADDPQLAANWLWLAAATHDPAQKRSHLHHAFALDPHDQRVIAGLRALGETVESPAVSASPQPELLVSPPALAASEPKLTTTHLLTKPAFVSTGVRARRPVSWLAIALACLIVVLIPLMLRLI